MDDDAHFIVQRLNEPTNDMPKTLSSTIHIDMPNRTDGTLSKVPIMLHLPEEVTDNLVAASPEVQMIAEEDIQDLEPTAEEPEVLLLEQFPDISQAMLNGINLEDFVDVVTTYKCKFCRFTCPWKSGLMSHIRNAHIMKLAGSSTSTNNSKNQANEVPEIIVANDNHEQIFPRSDLLQKLSCHQDVAYSPRIEDQPIQVEEADHLVNYVEERMPQSLVPPLPPSYVGGMQETHMFLCGQCHQGFDSFENCKNHIVADHNSVPEIGEHPEELQQPPKEKKKRKPRRKLQRYAIETDTEYRSINKIDEFSERLGKRTVRPPKALSQDYLMDSQKRKYTKRQQDDTKIYRCNEQGCNYASQTEASRDFHTSCHYCPADDLGVLLTPTYQCPSCPADSQSRIRLESWSAMIMHLWKVHKVDLGLLACNDCDYRTNSAFKMDNHKRVHNVKKDLKCPECSKTFKQLSLLRQHQHGQPCKTGSQHLCATCGRRFADTKCLRKHEQVVHSNVRQFCCPVCGHASARRAMLELHLRQHTGEKPFTCNHPNCSYTTADHNSLRRHKMRHSGLKPYQCPHCPYAAIQAISYKQHLSSKHPGEAGLFACKICPFRSVSEDNYTHHIADHRRGVLPKRSANNRATTTTTETTSAPAAVTFRMALAPNVPKTATNLTVATQQQMTSSLPENLMTAQLLVYRLISQEQQVLMEKPTNPSVGRQPITIQIPSGYGLTGNPAVATSTTEVTSDTADPIYLTLMQPAATSSNIGEPECEQPQLVLDNSHQEMGSSEPVNVDDCLGEKLQDEDRQEMESNTIELLTSWSKD